MWDTPGLVDGTQIDEHHKEVITELLKEKDEDGITRKMNRMKF